MDYSVVRQELEHGTPAELLCATCPWDRICISPPSIGSAQIDRHIEEAEARDRAKHPDGKGIPIHILLTTMVFAGRDTAAQLCPVYAARLTGPRGREIADAVREQMRGWKD